jgi:hypothetical protein
MNSTVMAALTECEDCVWPKSEVVCRPALLTRKIPYSVIMYHASIAGDLTGNNAQTLITGA